MIKHSAESIIKDVFSGQTRSVADTSLRRKAFIVF